MKEIHTSYVEKQGRKHHHPSLNHVLFFMVLNYLLVGCAGQPSQVEQIQRLPESIEAPVFPEGVDMREALALVYGAYCSGLAGNCNPDDLVSRTDLNMQPDPLGKYSMTTEYDYSTNEHRTTIYGGPARAELTQGAIDHEATHLNVTRAPVPPEVLASIGVPEEDEVFYDGFSMVVPSLAEEGREALPAYGEALADAVELYKGQQLGVRRRTSYGQGGYLMIALAEEYGISMDELIVMHQNSDLLGFMQKITGQNDSAHNISAYMYYYPLIDAVNSGTVPYEDALDTIRHNRDQGADYSPKENQFVDLLEEYGVSEAAMMSARDVQKESFARMMQKKRPSPEATWMSFLAGRVGLIIDPTELEASFPKRKQKAKFNPSKGSNKGISKPHPMKSRAHERVNNGTGWLK
ncbi:hypothetical protein A2334_03805 [Candidatus Roizmanbacteria bacterium RIFOXYB2_FULL_38_10]|uniref:Uncharacterized protein n=1 Tax=Candidatus Roizmanbacteria bacterium RIFOXYD1_FULL_38_12 TaxID=1802093 RepID=A0A1F7L1T7_9BACT|nr:MAG: hypothetical protein A3K47_04915 [Candidatus Roizmanbacteria bacterium RIFOXYA2_FULL_38_14]OGK64090.1 MAG: hypothetical protein A3K27_04915 [Candidatus Roizmanbacteria bacterium RIFOXYA1_FULL_37_12]OGK65936.1 MAG: hypothetical protein A3K38_04915 [Candidatus Roizmanbacteria bacterium RIFOXYB1_FULL_40_23]OGK67342.1 MAG: hypothetical protein A2334_03805 [Candidatus Roizmanbacteria bacterium RIFOXYB2_FULL_38_10]OGK70341.1 MAG: hypothetical protein A3K21_04920 [Candidatus Roizmanbacteria ba